MIKTGYTLKKHDETLTECITRVFVVLLMAVFVLISICGNIGAWGDDVGYTLLAAVTTMAFMIIFTKFSERTHDAYKSWMLVIFVISFSLRIIMVNTWQITPVSDFVNTYDVACGIANTYIADIPSYLRSVHPYYYDSWAAHMPYILYQTFIIKIFGEGIYNLQLLNCIAGALSSVVVAMITKSIFGRRCAILAGIVMSVLPVNLMYAPVLTNQHMATLFFLIGVYFLVANPVKYRVLNVGFSGLAVAISQLFRPEMVVFLVAVICYFIYLYIFNINSKRRAKRRLKKFMSRAVMFLAVTLALVFSVNIFLSQHAYIKGSIADSNVDYKIAVGLNEQSGGRWNEADGKLVDDVEKLQELISERSADIGKVISLGVRKIAYQFGTYDYPWIIPDGNEAFANVWHNPLTNGVMFVILLLALVGVILSFINKTRSEIFLYILMIGYYIVYMIIEVQSRYNFFAIGILVVLACGASGYVCSKLKKAWEYIKEKFMQKVSEGK